MSQREAAKALGVSAATINSDVQEANGKRSKSEHRATKAERRAQREIALSQKQAALPSEQYGVILADPEWRFEPYSRETGMDRAADNHYPTSTLDVIKSREFGPMVTAHIANLLLRRSHSFGRTAEAKVGWNTVTIDGYFYTLAIALAAVLKTDKAIRQLHWALAVHLDERKLARRK